MPDVLGGLFPQPCLLPPQNIWFHEVCCDGPGDCISTWLQGWASLHIRGRAEALLTALTQDARKTRDCSNCTAVSHCQIELLRSPGILQGRNTPSCGTGKGKGTTLHKKANLHHQTDHGVIKQICKISLLRPCKEGQVKIKSCFQILQVRHVITQAVVSEALPPHSPPSQLTHPSVVSCMNSSCQSHERLLLQPYQQQI